MSSLRRKEPESLWFGINESTLVPSSHGWLIMKVLHLKERGSCQLWINDWPSLNHSCASRFMPKVTYLSLVVFLLASCQTRQSAPFASDSALACGSRSDHLFSTNHFCEVHNIATLELKAELILAVENDHSFRRVKPEQLFPQSATGLKGFLELIPRRELSGSGLLILHVPSIYLSEHAGKTMDEVILDVRDAALAHGFEHFVVESRLHGVPVWTCADELPSRADVEQRKREPREFVIFP
jgi:hypothetical protein